MPLTPDEIGICFAKSHESEWPTLARRVIRYSEPILESRYENNRTAQVIFQAFDEVDFAAYSIFQNHERKMH
jgi:hypothetical protein